MNKAPHPLLAGLWRDGAAPAQVVAHWMAQRERIDAVAQGLPRIALDEDAPWVTLLRLPLADGDAGLRSALQALDNAQSDALPPNPVAASRRAGGVAPDAARSAEALPRGLPSHDSRAATLAAAPSVAAASRRAAASMAQRSIDATAAASHWQQRAQRAGLEEAYHTPLRNDGRRSAAQAAGLAGSAAIEAPLMPAMAATVDGAASVSPLPAEARRGLQPASRRLEAVLVRLLHDPEYTAPSGSQAAVTTPAMPVVPVVGDGRRTAQPANAAPAAPAQLDLPSGGATGFGGGLRGLAARAAAMASAETVGATAPLPSAAAAQPAASPSPAAARPESAPTPPDDERLAERLAALLRREALRDGIDLSQVQS